MALIATDDPYGKGWEAALRAKMTEMHPQRSSVEVMYVDPRVNDTSYNWNTDLSRLVDGRNENTNAGRRHARRGLPGAAAGGLGARPPRPTARPATTIPLQATTAFRRLHILRSLGPVAEGVEGASPGRPPGDSGAAFEAAFKAEYGEDPEMLSSGAYDCAVTHMLAALVAIGTSSDASPGHARGDPAVARPDQRSRRSEGGGGADRVHQGAQRDQDGPAINYQGATGDTTFDANGDTHPLMVHYRVEGRQFRELESYTCTEARPLCANSNEITSN